MALGKENENISLSTSRETYFHCSLRFYTPLPQYHRQGVREKREAIVAVASKREHITARIILICLFPYAADKFLLYHYVNPVFDILCSNKLFLWLLKFKLQKVKFRRYS